MNDARYQREAEFHDKTFAEDSRQSVEKFYAITRASKVFYRNYLTTHCVGKRVLEYGCGPHSHAILMAPRGAVTTGIDLSSVAIEFYRDIARQKRISHLDGCVMNAEQLGFADSSFDLICGTGILHHLDLDRSLREISRALRPRGTAVFLEPLGHNPLINWYRNRTPALRSVDEHPLLVKDFEKAREFFGKVELTYFHLASLGAVLFGGTRAFGAVLGWLEGVDRTLFRWCPPLRKHAWAVALVLGEPIKSAVAPARQVLLPQTVQQGG